jgi:hypothetical protein
MHRGHAAIGLLFLNLAAVASTACGSDGANAPASRPAPATSTEAAAAPTAAPNRCPLTAEHATAALGVPMKPPDSSCSFFPVDEAKVRPDASFILQMAIACSGNVPGEAGYTDRATGLGPPAYVAERADGTWLLVCRDGAPFEVRVDIPNRAAGREATMVLARHVLAAR